MVSLNIFTSLNPGEQNTFFVAQCSYSSFRNEIFSGEKGGESLYNRNIGQEITENLARKRNEMVRN